MYSLWFAPLVTAVIVVSLIALLLKYANAWVLDIPNERSLHTQPIPRFGGVVMIAVGLGVVSLHRTVVPGWAGAVALSLLSFLDDRKSLPIILRLSIHVLTAVLTLWGLLPVNLLWLLPLLMLVVVWSTNLFNFMDGADGLAGGMALIGFAAYGLAAFVAGERSYALTFFVIAGAAGGFLFFNFHPARIFLGDGGSIPLGFLAAIWGIVGVIRGIWSPLFPVIVMAPFWVDATVTLVKRVLNGDAFWIPHRNHYYQRLVRMGWGHRRTSLCWHAATMVCAVFALMSLRGPTAFPWIFVLGFFLSVGGILWAIDLKWSARFFAAEGKARPLSFDKKNLC